MNKSWFLALPALILALSSAPVAGQSSYPDKLTDVDAPGSGQSLAIGTVMFFRDGKQKSCGAFLVSQCRLIVLPPSGRHAMIYPFTGNLPFSWSLQPGEYTIIGIEYVENGIKLAPVRTHFTVPAAGKTVYIGDLALSATRDSTDVGLARSYDTAVAQFRGKYPDQPQPEDATMTPDPGLGTSKDVKYICAEGWGIVCTKRFRGVTRLLPSRADGFEATDRINPAFQWQPSSDPRVTYDIAVYEAADYRGYQRKTYLPGRLVAYREALTTPAWQIDHPLLPGNRYFWSVRLRRGETVSNWSTYSFFNFFLVGFSSGYGQWFSFSTPGGTSTQGG